MTSWLLFAGLAGGLLGAWQDMVSLWLASPLFWGVVLGAAGLVLLLPQGDRRSQLLGAACGGVGLLGVLLSLPQLGDALAQVVFWLMAGTAIASAAATISMRSPVYCAIAFALTLLATAGLFLFSGAQFLGVATIVVYAGAILVTFLFVLMVAQPEGHAIYDRLTWGWGAKGASVAAAGAFVLLAATSFAQLQREGHAPRFQSGLRDRMLSELSQLEGEQGALIAPEQLHAARLAHMPHETYLLELQRSAPLSAADEQRLAELLRGLAIPGAQQAAVAIRYVPAPPAAPLPPDEARWTETVVNLLRGQQERSARSIVEPAEVVRVRVWRSTSLVLGVRGDFAENELASAAWQAGLAAATQSLGGAPTIALRTGDPPPRPADAPAAAEILLAESEVDRYLEQVLAADGSRTLSPGAYRGCRIALAGEDAARTTELELYFAAAADSAALARAALAARLGRAVHLRSDARLDLRLEYALAAESEAGGLREQVAEALVRSPAVLADPRLLRGVRLRAEDDVANCDLVLPDDAALSDEQKALAYDRLWSLFAARDDAVLRLTFVRKSAGANVLSREHMAGFGAHLFSRHLLEVEVAGVLLLVALVGAVAIVIQGKRPPGGSST